MFHKPSHQPAPQQRLRLLLGVLPVTLLALAAPSQAQVVTYTDRAAFAAATATTTGLTTIDFNDQATPGESSTQYPNATVTLQGVTFTSNGSLIALGSDFDPSYDLGNGNVLSFQGAFNSPDVLTIALPTGTTAFGLDFGSFTGTAFTFTLSTGDSFSFSSSTTPTSFPTFFGVTALAPVTGITINGGFNNAPMIDRVSFGPQAAAAAPEPESLALLLTAGIPVVGLVRRRAKART